MWHARWKGLVLRLVFVGLTAAPSSCGRSGQDTPQGPSDLGELAIPLEARAASGTVYRLVGIFYVTGKADLSLSTEDVPGAPAIKRRLADGDYAVTLADGWELRRKADAGLQPTSNAVLVSPQVQSFSIRPGQTTQVVFKFEVDKEPLSGEGTLEISVSVEERARDGGAAGDGATDAGADAPNPMCAVGPYSDGDAWDGTYDFQQWYIVPFTVGARGRLVAGFYRGYAFSDDEGQTWTTRELSAQISARRHWPHPAVSANGASVWLFVAGQGVLHSSDGGDSFAWVSALSGLASFQEGWVSVSPYDERHILAYAVSEDFSGSLIGSLYRSMDGGSIWVSLDQPLAASGATDAHAIAFDPSTPNRFWIADMPAGVFETNDGGASFVSLRGSTHAFISDVARTFDGTNDRLAVLGSCAAPKSTVIGQNLWSDSVGDSPHCCPWPTMAVDPFNLSTAVAYQCHDALPPNLRYSTNGGVNLTLATWPSSLDVDGHHMRSVSVDPHHSRTFFATHDNEWTILKSSDGGKNWNPVGWLPGHGCAPNANRRF